MKGFCLILLMAVLAVQYVLPMSPCAAAEATTIVPITPVGGVTADGDETLCRGPVREAVKAVASRLAGREWFHRQPVRRILRAAAGVGHVACRRRR